MSTHHAAKASRNRSKVGFSHSDPLVKRSSRKARTKVARSYRVRTPGSSSEILTHPDCLIRGLVVPLPARGHRDRMTVAAPRLADADPPTQHRERVGPSLVFSARVVTVQGCPCRASDAPRRRPPTTGEDDPDCGRLRWPFESGERRYRIGPARLLCPDPGLRPE
jgi:hypothetical protein